MLVHTVGGADVAAELDAKRAIDHASRLAAVIEEQTLTRKFKYEPYTTLEGKMVDWFAARQ